MIRRLLLPIDTHPSSEIAIRYAMELYRRQRCAISAISVVDIPGIESRTFGIGIGVSSYVKEGREELIHQEEAKAQAALVRFERACAAEKIPVSDTEVFSSPIQAILQAGHFFDLIAMGIGSCPSQKVEDDTDTLRKLIRKSSTPVLAIPETYRPVKRALICFNHTGPSARALHLFALLQPFLLDEVLITTVTTPSERSTDQHLLDQAVHFLHAYGLPARAVLLEGKPRKAIPDFVDHEGLDLVVLGAHSGGSSLREFFIGSLADELIRRRTVPLFVNE